MTCRAGLADQQAPSRQAGRLDPGPLAVPGPLAGLTRPSSLPSPPIRLGLPDHPHPRSPCARCSLLARRDLVLRGPLSHQPVRRVQESSGSFPRALRRFRCDVVPPPHTSGCSSRWLRTPTPLCQSPLRSLVASVAAVSASASSPPASALSVSLLHPRMDCSQSRTARPKPPPTHPCQSRRRGGAQNLQEAQPPQGHPQPAIPFYHASAVGASASRGQRVAALLCLPRSRPYCASVRRSAKKSLPYESQPGLEEPRKTACFFGRLFASGGWGYPPDPLEMGREEDICGLGYTRQGLGARAQIWGNRKVGVRHHLQGK